MARPSEVSAVAAVLMEPAENDKCEVCVNPRTRRQCGRPAVAARPHPVFEPTPMCEKHYGEAGA